VKAALIVALLAAGLPAMAQQGAQRPAPARPPAAQPGPAAVPEPLPPAYEPDLLKLAEAIGSLAFLRQLCGAAEAQQWRARMTELLETEGVTPGRKERLAGAYNRGFKSFALTYRICTAAAEEASQRLFLDGERLSRSLAGRFGG
jgi:uncharacterized protein (TIGR02301 family)